MRTTLVLPLLVILSTGSAYADGVLLESYGSTRPGDAEALVAPIREELATPGYQTGSRLGQKIESRVSKTASLLPDAKLQEAAKFIASGFDQHLGGNWGIAAKELGHGIDLLLSAPLSMVKEQAHRDRLFDGLVALARSQMELRQTERAKQTIAELLRTFPKQELSRAKYPPVVHKLYREAAEEIRLSGLGSLSVQADKGVMVFVNERLIGLGDVRLTDLVPGEYRVYIQRGEQNGRVHQVRVPMGGQATLQARWRLDGSLRSAADFVGFEFEDEGERAEFEAIAAVEVARAVNADDLAVVGIREDSGRRSIIGTVYSLETGKVMRSATIAVEPIPPSAEKIRVLGRFLAGDEAAARLFRDVGSADPVGAGPSRRPDVAHWYADRLGWTLLAGGVVAAAVGGGFLMSASGLDDDAASEPDQDRRQRLLDSAHDRRLLGNVFVVTGGAVAVAAVVKLWLRPTATQSSAPSVVASTAGLGSISLRWRF